METTIKFECVQWPVGHGGFHTGRFKGGDVDFRYFFDCGACSKEGKSLIREKLTTTEFDFGVISHFDRDHYSELADAKKVGVLFLPYMTQSDMVLQALADQAANKLSVAQAFKGFELLRQLQDKGTRIVMVDGRDDVQGGNAQASPTELQGGLQLHIPSVSRDAVTHKEEIRHAAAVEVKVNAPRNSEAQRLYFKFFNHRMEEASLIFEKHLKDAVDTGKLKKEDKTTSYTDVNDFLSDVAAGTANVVHMNGKELQGVYKKALSDATLKASPITGSNLSSLTMFSRSPCYRHRSANISSTALRTQYPHNGMQVKGDGWMLTGDLELTPKTWPAFSDHYFNDLSECSVFNVPHHASAISLCDEAVAFLASRCFVMPVDAGDDKHPADALTVRLNRHRVNSQQSVTTAWESMVVVESSLRL